MDLLSILCRGKTSTVYHKNFTCAYTFYFKQAKTDVQCNTNKQQKLNMM